jgi:hypothetical protein
MISSAFPRVKADFIGSRHTNLAFGPNDTCTRTNTPGEPLPFFLLDGGQVKMQMRPLKIKLPIGSPEA